MPNVQPVVLCVEDDPSTRQILTKILGRLPVRTVMATDPAQAIELARQVQPQLLMLDLMLPGMSGWEVLDRIRADAPGRDLRVMILSAKDSSAERLVAANVAQVDFFQSKPFDPVVLGRDVLRLLNLPIDDVAWPAAKGDM
jgi:CheY-like chemotaxis protein